jgi:hypothetical protein
MEIQAFNCDPNLAVFGRSCLKIPEPVVLRRLKLCAWEEWFGTDVMR